MWKPGQVVKKCMNENHHIIATAQRARFKEAKEKLAEGYYLVGEGIADVSRA